MSTALNVTVIVSRDARIIQTEHVRDSLDFVDKEEADRYRDELLEWVAKRPLPRPDVADLTWTAVTLEPAVIVAYDADRESADEQADRLGEILRLDEDDHLFRKPTFYDQEEV